MDLAARAADLPTDPGVYLFLGPRGKVLYVGKAINLRARVKQYLAGNDERQMVPFLVHAAADVDVVVTATEKEALILENTLIKKHRPRYNVKLRDDANFLHLRIDLRREWPRYDLVRTIRNDGAQYFGPYHSASKARATLQFLQRAFPLRTCTDAVLRSRKRPCLLHQMGRCVAPCMPDLIDSDDYAQLAKESTTLLKGQTSETIGILERRMKEYAEELEFEQAARTRDLITTLRETVERQAIVDTKLGHRDVWGLHLDGPKGAVAILPIREGVMGEPRAHLIAPYGSRISQLLAALINTAYPPGSLIPAEILVPEEPEGREALEEVLSERRGRQVKLRVPQRGAKRKLIELAERNAKVRYLRETDEEERHALAMAELARVLELPEPPHRIECFDNSNWGGTNPVAAMSVFIEGRPARREYRRYKIKTVVGSDDYASMAEIIDRRFRRAIKEGTRPDVLVVDGGKGQLGVAMAVLADLGLHDQVVCGISKPRTEHKKGNRHATDKIVLPHRKDPLKLRPGNPALRILQHLRDEVHNHAIRYHREVRRKATLGSVLEEIEGVGPSRRKALLKAFGSAQGVADATPEELTALPGVGPSLAQTIWSALNPE